MSKITNAVNTAKELYQAGKTIHAGNKAAGKVAAKVVKGAAGFVNKHPAASLRIAGGVAAVSGVKDISSYVKGKDRNTRTLLKGIAKLAIGSGLLIYNDQFWYEQLGKIEYAANKSRPMDPIYITDITRDATNGGMGKLVDVYVSWGNYYDSLAFKTASFRMMQVIRDGLKSNLPYTQEDLEHMMVDGIAIVTYMSQLSRQMGFRKFSPQSFPNFYKLWSKTTLVDSGYGPHTLTSLEQFDDDHIANTISNYDALVDIVSLSLRVPRFIAAFIGHYFSNLFRSDADDSNPQYITMRMNSIPYSQYDVNDNFLEYNLLDMSRLSVEGLAELIAEYQRRYVIIMADMRKERVNIGVDVQFMHYVDLPQTTIYDESLIQALINAYTSDSQVTDDGYIRMDQFKNGIDEYTQFLFLGAINERNEGASLYTPTFKMLSMQIKFESNSLLDWGHTLDQDDNFNFAQDFALIISTDVDVDSVVNITEDGSEAISQNFIVESDLTDVDVSISVGNSGGTRSPVYVYGTSSNASTYLNVYAIEQANDTITMLTPIFMLEGSDIIYAYVNKHHFTENPSNTTFESFNDGQYLLTIDKTTISESLLNNLKNGAVYVFRTQLGMAAGLSLGEAPIDNIQFISYAAMVIYTRNGNDASNRTVNYPATASVDASNHPIITAMFENVALDSGEYSVLVPMSSMMSFRNGTVYGIVSESSVSVVEGFTGLVPFIADQLDYHLPIVQKHTTTVIFNGRQLASESGGTDLIKENYIPYMYNVTDLVPTLYRMFSSLFLDLGSNS